MKKLTQLVIFACMNISFAILLIHKQNKITSTLYEIQQLQEKREALLEKKKELTIQLHKEQQLSSIETFASDKLHMKPIKIKEVKTLAQAKD